MCRQLICLLMALAAACLVNTAHAIDPNRAMSQYTRDRWSPDEGFPGGPVYAITQTADGYLWIGTEKGLVRFDGMKFHLIQHTNTPPLPAGPVHGLTVDAEGTLWIRLLSPNLIRFRNGKFEEVLPDSDLAEPRVTAMSRGTNGEVLFSELRNGIFRYSEARVERLASMSELPNFLVISMAETPDGDIWMGTRDAGIFRMSKRQTSHITKGLPDRKINCLLPGAGGELWVGTDSGVVRWDGSEITSNGVPPALSQTKAFSMIKDRDANVWIGTAGGLLRLNASGVTLLEKHEQGLGGAVTALFEDREGNLWVGGAQGIERLRERAFMTYSTSEGLPSERIGPIYADSEDRRWFAPSDGGLYWLRGNQIGRVTNSGLDKDIVYSITGGKDDLWIGRQRGGLTHLHFNGASFSAETYTEAEGLAQNSVYAVHRSRDGTVWAGTLSGGVSRFKDGQFATHTTANGLPSNTVTSILESADATMWFATSNGLSALSNGRWHHYTGRDGLPSENVNSLLEDSNGVIWIGTDKGLTFFSAGRVQFPPNMPASLHEPVMGLAEDKYGSLWVATSNQVLRVKRDKMMHGGLSVEDVHEYGLADGLDSSEGVKRHRTVVSDPAGRIWFSLNSGLSVVDPARLTGNSAPAIVHIKAVSADGNPVELRAALRIPAARQRITFGFEGLSLSVPERVKFRYMLDGLDQDWSEPTATREAIYTNLSPGSYRFRVIANNSEGLWNSEEATIEFEIEPAFYQIWWFRLSSVVACGLALLALYRFRLQHLTRQLNIRFEERLAERTRIAQELHDTLLQGFLSASMQLHVAVENLPVDSPAKPQLSRIQLLMGQVIEEGRNAVRGLRSHIGDSLDLEHAFSRIRQELIIEEQIEFRVIVEGRPRALHPIIRDEVYRIGREALVNAFRHSRAKSIEIEVEYSDKHLRLLVNDDGRGIDSQMLQRGRDGHWGLSGMRERAERIGAGLKVRSRDKTGTEVELTVPSHVAFKTNSSGRKLRWFTRPRPRKATEVKVHQPGSEGDQ